MIFDLDGVIADTHPIHRRAWRQLLQEMGRQVSEEELEVVQGGHQREVILRHFLGRLSDAEIILYGERKDQLFHEGAGELRAIPGVVELLEALESAGVPKALATSASSRRALLVLERLGLTGRFQAVVTAEDVANCKPDPAIFYLAATRLQIMPHQFVVAEDSEAGVRAAKSAGMMCLGIANRARAPRLSQAGADAVVPDFRSVSLADLQARFPAPAPTSGFPDSLFEGVSKGVPGGRPLGNSESPPPDLDSIGQQKSELA